MSYKNVLVVALLGSVLVGCGGGSGPGGRASGGYSMSDYEGRAVETESLSGTWVAIGSGNLKVTEFGDDIEINVSTKEFFVITQDLSGYKKSTCAIFNRSETESVAVNGNTVSFGGFNGTVSNNSKINGFTNDQIFNDVSVKINAIKISDSIRPIAVINSNINGIDYSENLSCYNRADLSVNSNGFTEELERIIAPSLFMGESKKDEPFSFFAYFKYDIDLNTDQRFSDSANVKVNINSSLSETVTFSGSNNFKRISGSILVQLPSQ